MKAEKKVYDNSVVRRQDRLLEESEAYELLRRGEYGFLAIAGPSGGYGIPISYVWNGNSIFFHCAPEGEKLRLLTNCSEVSFCVVGHTNVLPNRFTTEYESVILFGHMEVVTMDSERRDALGLLLDKYAADHKEVGMKYMEGSLHRTTVLRLRIRRMSGKMKRVHPVSEAKI